MHRRSSAARTARAVRAVVEMLEDRQLMSGTAPLSQQVVSSPAAVALIQQPMFAAAMAASANSSPVVMSAASSNRVTADKSLLVFNAVDTQDGGVTSPAKTVTITNSGSVPVSLGAAAIIADPNSMNATPDASSFAVANASSIPATLNPGQSFKLNITFTPASAALDAALLQIPAGSSTLSVQLHGIGTTGIGGANEPSLARILRAFDIPTIVGDGQNDVNQAGTFYPAIPDASSQEIKVQRLIKAGNGPVTITPLAVFANAATPTLRFGYYAPGVASAKTELYTVDQANAQTVNPVLQGAAAFDPGSQPFGLYSSFTNVAGKTNIAYSEDVLNTWDTTVPRHIRFFLLENADGSVVPNAYVFAAEDNNQFFAPNIQPYDFNDMVGIIRNVKAAPDATGAPVIGLENMDVLPSNNRMVFSTISIKNTTFPDIVHDTGVLRIHNGGDQPLTISAVTFSDIYHWYSPNLGKLPMSIAPGASFDLNVKFIADSAPKTQTLNETNDTATDQGIPVTQAGGVWNGTVSIVSNDPLNPQETVQLAGYWQKQTENENEPGLQTIVNTMFGYQTNVSNTYQPNYPNNGSTAVYYGEEVASGLWKTADPTQPVSIRQLDAYHNQFSTYMGQPVQPAASIGWYAQGNSGSTNWVFQDQPGASQTILPPIKGSNSTLATGTFSPGGTFGLNLDGELSQDSLNAAHLSFGRSGHSVRFWPLRDSNGNLVPNTWIVGLDYENSTFDNSDYQDVVYIVSNMRPAAQAPSPLDVQASGGDAGVTIQWAPVSDSSLLGYNIYRSNSPTSGFTNLNIATLSGTSFIDTTAPAGQVSYYKITAVDSNGESVGTGTSALAEPAAPGGLTAAAVAAGQVQLTWPASVGASAYRIERQGPGDADFVQLAAGVTANSFLDTTVLGSSTYVYRVLAENGSGLSAYSPVAQATTPAAIPPGAPGAPTVTQVGPTQVSLSWAASDGAVSRYHIEREAPGDSAFVEIGTTATNGYVDTAVSANNTYVYRVRAENAGAYSGYSSSVSATTPVPAFTSIDVNSTPAGSTNVITPGSAYDVTGGGADIGGSNADGFRYVYTQVVGDFDAVVQVNSLSQVQSGTRAGLMVRDALTAGSRMVFAGATASDGYRFNYRTTADGMGAYYKYGSVSYPNVWVRLTRQGDVITGYYSIDGQHWTQTGALTLSLPQTVYLGMAVCSHTTAQTATAQFRSLAIASSSATPVPQPPTDQPPTQDPSNLTPAQQVAADRAALKLAQVQRVQRLRSQQKTLASDTRAYNAALHKLRVAMLVAKRAHKLPGEVDPSLSADVNRLLNAVRSDRSTLITLQKTDFTGIAAARQKLAADLVTLHKSARK